MGRPSLGIIQRVAAAANDDDSLVEVRFDRPQVPHALNTTKLNALQISLLHGG